MKIDASIGLDNGNIHFFVGSDCISHGFSTNQLEAGYPKPISSQWKGIWSDLDAVVQGHGSSLNKLYFFKGNQYLRYDLSTDRIDPGYPKSTSIWKGLWSDKVKAGIKLPTNNKYYFFRDDEYIRYDFDKGIDPGYPRKISSAWPGVWPDFENVCMGQGDRANKAYFFKGSQYLRYDVSTSKVDPDYPKPLSVWTGLSQGLNLLSGKAKRRVKVQLLDVYCKETEDNGIFGVASEDELTMLWGGIFGTTGVSGDWSTDIDNENRISVKPREKSVLFDGELTEDSTFELIVSLIDRDSGEKWKQAKGKIEEYVKKGSTLAKQAAAASQAGGGTTSSGATGSFLASSSGGTIEGLVADLISKIGGLDGDDFLGEDQIYTSVGQLPAGEKDHSLRFTGDGADYTVRVRTTTV